MGAIKLKTYSFDEYLALEAETQQRHEFWNGEVWAMAGGTLRHQMIVDNLVASVRPQIKGKGCRLMYFDVKLALEMHQKYVYPDLMMTCNKEDLSDLRKTGIQHPSLVVEVLSDSTASYDTLEKKDAYFQVPALQYYLILSQDKMQAELYSRMQDFWKVEVLLGKDAQINMPKLGIEMKLERLYEEVKLN